MSQVVYDVVTRLIEHLSLTEQKTLLDHLQTVVQTRTLSFEEWKAVFDSLKIDTPIVGEFSDRRVDWYNDDGR